MSAAVELEEVMLKLPRETVQRARELAKREQRSLEEEAEILLEEAMDARLTSRELLGRLSAEYRERLAREGNLHRSADEILAELQRIREEVADDIDPR